MQSSSKTKLVELNQLLTCVLCKGYFIDATTIVECLHSFCRTCIVDYLQTNKFCPSCEVQVHKTRPLQNIRSDQTLQDIVYKIVPGLFKNEMKRRRDFYQQQDALDQNSIPSSSEKRGDIWGCDRLIFTPEDVISVSIEYYPLNEQMPVNMQANMQPVKKKKLMKAYKRYFNCPGALQIYHLKKLLTAKYGLLNSKKKLDILYMHDILKNQYTLVDLAYIYSWKRSEPLRLFFKVTQETTMPGELNGTLLPTFPHSSLPSSPNAIPIATPVSSMASTPSSRHPSPPPSPQMAQEPNDVPIGKPNPAAIPESNGPEKTLRRCGVVLEANGFRHGKSTLLGQSAAKLHSATVKEEPKGHKAGKSIQSSAKHKSSVLGPNKLDTEMSGHGSHSIAKIAKNIISQPNVFKSEKILQCEQSTAKRQNSEPNGLVDEKPFKAKYKSKFDNDSISQPNVSEQSEKLLRSGHSGAKPDSVMLKPNGDGFDKSVRDVHVTTKLSNSVVLQPKDISGRKTDLGVSCKIEKDAVQYPNLVDLEKSMRSGLDANMPTAVVVLKKVDSPRFHKDHSNVISFPEFAMKRALKKSATVVGNTRRQSTGDKQLGNLNASIPLPKLKSVLKKTVSNNMTPSPIMKRRHGPDRQLLMENELSKEVLSKGYASPGNGFKKRVSFGVNLVQDCSSRGLKRELPDYFDDEASFPVNGSAMGRLMHLRKKVLSPKSS